MFLLNNSFDPHGVIMEIQRRTSLNDIPELDLLNIERFLNQWIKEWYEGSIEENDPLIDLMFTGISFINLNTIKVYPIHWRTVEVTNGDHVYKTGFPIIIMEYFKQ